MGKSKNKRFKAIKPNPLGLGGGIESKDLDIDKEAIPSVISNVLEKIKGSSQEEKSCGCQLMASIVSQRKAIDLLLQNDIVRITAPLFLDASHDVGRNALGAIRNLCVYGSEKATEAVVEKDIFTPLSSLIKKYDTTWVPENRGSQTKHISSLDVIVEAVELVTVLCENSSQAVQLFNRNELLLCLLPKLNVENYGYSLATAVAHCLHVVSENNPQVSLACKESEVLSQLLHGLSSTSTDLNALMYRSYISGVVLNSEIDLSPYYRAILQGICEALAINYVDYVKTVKNEEPESESDLENSCDEIWPDAEKLLTTQNVCLEILANLFCSDDEWEEVEDDSSESADDNNETATTDMEVFEEALCLPSEVQSVLQEKNIIQLIISKATPLEPALETRLKESNNGKALLHRLLNLQSRALLCLSNTVSVLDESLVSCEALSSLWTDLHSLATTQQTTDSEEYKWCVTSAMRAVLQKIADLKLTKCAETFLKSDIDFLVGLAKDSKHTETQINVVKLVSAIGCLLSLNNPPAPLLKTIGEVLLDVACNNLDLVVIAEALDSIFDVFKEDETDPIVREIGLVEKLQQLQPSFKAKAKSQRKKLGENYAVVMTAKANLAGYIQYKCKSK